jgi:hypothetical protein
MTLAEQLRTVSQEEEQCEVGVRPQRQCLRGQLPRKSMGRTPIGKNHRYLGKAWTTTHWLKNLRHGGKKASAAKIYERATHTKQTLGTDTQAKQFVATVGRL